MSLSIDLNRFINKTTKNADAKVRVICLDLMSGIVLKTPVDTGRARANWQASIGAAKDDTLNATDKNGTATITANADAVAKAPGNVFWLTNNLPYISRLEYEGWSSQAPRGMVRLTIDEVQRRLR